MDNEKGCFHGKFADSKWLMQVANLADMFAEINSLNILMQSCDQTLVGLSEKPKAFKDQLKLRINKIKAGTTASFPSVNALLENENLSLTKVQDIIEEHIFKTGFSAFTVTKTKHKSRLRPEDDLRCSISSKLSKFQNLQYSIRTIGL